MKRSAVLPLLLLLAAPLALPAQYFSKNIGTKQLGDSGLNILNLPDGRLLILQGNVSTDFASSVGLTWASPAGEVLADTLIENFKLPTGNAIVLADSSLFLLMRPNAPADKNIHIARLSLDGQWQQGWYFGEEMDYERPFGLTAFPGGFVAYGANTPPNTTISTGFQLFLDDSLRLQNTFFFEEEGPYDIVAEVDYISTQDGALVATTVGGYNGAREGITTKLNLYGQVLWQRRLPVADVDDKRYNVIELNDGSLAASGYYDWEAEHPAAPIGSVIYGLSPQGDSLWAYRFITFEPNHNFIIELDKAANGDIIGSGYTSVQMELFGDIRWAAWIFRLAPGGSLKWSRFIYDTEPPFDGAWLESAAELPNGGLLFTGTTYDTFSIGQSQFLEADTWLVRVDSNGCLTPGCGNLQIVTDTGVVQLTPVREEPRPTPPQPFRLGPNPLREQLFLHLAPGSGPPLREVELRLSNALGQPAWRHRWSRMAPGQQVSALLPELPPGWYAWSLTVEGQWRQSGGVLKVR